MTALAAAPVRRTLDTRAVGLMLLLCAIWGFQQVAIKSTNAAIAPMFQAGLRSAIAALLLWGWARSRGTPLFQADGTFGASVLAGLAGDALGILGGAMWAATTVVVRSTALARASASKTLFYQLAVSALVLVALAALCGQMSFAQVTPIALASLAYQSVIVAFVSYLSWFWLLTRYSASRLSVFTFLSPLFGVAFGVLLLGESVGWRFMSAAALVLTGIALVNAPPRRRA